MTGAILSVMFLIPIETAIVQRSRFLTSVHARAHLSMNLGSNLFVLDSAHEKSDRVFKFRVSLFG